MTDQATITALRQLLVGDYDDLKRRLAKRLGSEELAGEALQETYLHLERPVRVGIVDSPKNYLLTIALNVARMAFRRERRTGGLAELDAALSVVDEAPDPLTSVEARQEVEALKRAFDALSPRRRYIILASRVEGRRLHDIAAELGLSQRSIEKELKAALLHCAEKMQRDLVQRFGPRPPQASIGTGAPRTAPDEQDD
ncbi:RNA polymerase sigma factor [Bradyrhizobium roseum]|uniref:RNA polymerase sigma factor n=1 Tax=Bradyrhizobium roseum TaxID=3056648 RepID=UPI00262F6AC2|nr:sigma-70 family RNA polymerase sigma factor [Bradyrhizobium roseus]WKA26112.1 sigma-70 family RNA polymerase sigma factor [Bradyrhizobium roseus]